MDVDGLPAASFDRRQGAVDVIGTRSGTAAFHWVPA
jgi:hypothetical protein